MASILKVDEMQGVTSTGDITITSEGGSATMQLQQGLAKAWMFFDTNTGAVVNDSLNISSITDVDVGRTTGSWTNSFGNTTYSGVCNTNAGSGTLYTSFGTQAIVTLVTRATTGYLGVASNSEENSACKDGDLNDLDLAFGDLA
jgi:hypothetical protein